MEKVINELTSHLKGISNIRYKLNDKEYWINCAKEEAGFIPREGDWISTDITMWSIRVHVYHKTNDAKGAKYWINGEWFDTPFPKSYPDL
jgi:hypothetical protein